MLKYLKFGMLVLSLTACQALKDLGKAPEMSKIENPLAKEEYQKVEMPLPEPQSQPVINKNSLWRAGSRGFFKDQRAFQVGDILTVNVEIKDAAVFSNKTSRQRGSDTGKTSINSLAGLEKYIDKALPGTGTAANLLDFSSASKASGQGSINRNEQINLTVAAIVTQVLPNENLVIVGTQEVRVNHELRNLTVSGVIRKSDITPKNTINSSQIAELRVSYGGRGVISTVQNPKVGQELVEILSPF
ncbi:MAG: Flagellar L-ring protein precursor [Alphaproteobacteria bacterium ADurb.Bin438]|nr:MAG: Flagellar L-ring protein precursor [Alphaproteobacteria bacterium ADurb.Bin438]